MKTLWTDTGTPRRAPECTAPRKPAPEPHKRTPDFSPPFAKLPAIRAIAYLRCSTTEQRDSGLGLDAQRDAMNALARREGLAIAQWHADEGVSGGSTIDKRPGLVAAIDALQRGNVLLVAKRDRLARDTMLACWLETEIAKRGARVVSASGEGSDDDSPTSVLMRRIIDAFAEYERLMIRARTKAAMRVKKQRGERLGRHVQYGYRLADGKRLEPDPQEQAAIAMMHRHRAAGMSYSEIAAKLQHDGHVGRNGQRLSSKLVLSVIRRSN